jgi:hypothetical protein
MKTKVVYRDRTDYARTVEEFLHDFERQTGKTIEVVNPDTRDGAQFCRVYDIVEYPTIIATTDDGVLQNTWRGLPLPTINEVSFYA